MHPIGTKLTATAIAAALFVSPTAAASATMSTAAQPSSTSWSTLSQLNPAGATALGVAAGAPDGAMIAGSAAAVQPADERSTEGNPLPIPVIVVLLGVLGTMIYIAFIEDHDGSATFPGGAVSPS